MAAVKVIFITSCCIGVIGGIINGIVNRKYGIKTPRTRLSDIVFPLVILDWLSNRKKK